MNENVIAVIRISYSASGRYEEVVGYVHYDFDAKTAIDRLNRQEPGEYITRRLPCLSRL